MTIAGNAPTLTVGKYGTGQVTCYGSQFSITDTSGANARMYIGRYPGSSGDVYLVFGPDSCDLTVGNVLRIGLDENDNPGGTGFLIATLFTTVTSDLIKVGPNGYIGMGGSTLNAELLNGGRLGVGDDGGMIHGNVTNSGLVELGRLSSTESSLDTTGSYAQTAEGTHRANIFSGVESVIVPMLNVNGVATFDGRIEAVFTTTPTSETTYTLITATSGITYAPTLQIEASGLPPGFQVTPGFGSNALSLQVTPGMPAADLAVTKSDSPDPVRTGQQLTYTASIANLSPDPATGVVLTDTLPAEVTLVSAIPSQGSCTGSMIVTCSLGGLANGTAATVTITVQVAVRPDSRRLVNTVNVTANEPDPNGANNTATAETRVIGRPRI
jgi:uncharacterized repeat protein (TIGR01451 family)